MGVWVRGTFWSSEFDSTCSQVEARDERGKIVLEGPDKEEKLEKSSQITDRGMSGKL